MAKYILLMTWTDQGIKTVTDSPKRLDAGKALAKTFGCEIEKFYMTIGAHDMALVLDGPTDDAVAKFVLSLAKLGNVRTTTLKAFTEDAYRAIMGALA